MTCGVLSANGQFLLGVMDVTQEFTNDFAAEPDIDECEADHCVLYHYLPVEREGKLIVKLDYPCFNIALAGPADVAWRPCCPPHRQMYALQTAQLDLLLVDASQHMLLRMWTIEELEEMADMELVDGVDHLHTLTWSPDGSHLLFNHHKGECLILSFT